jgi:ribonucleotide reductase beta subunit family protein with ferritin-like domain
VLYSATEVYNFYGIENPFEEVKEMPLPYMNKWLLIDSNQSSPQEENVGNYLLGAFVDDSAEMDTSKYELNFD